MKYLLLIFWLFVLQGCAFINIPLSSSTQPLQEEVLEGKGRSKILVLDISGIISVKPPSKFGLKEQESTVTFIKESLDKAKEDCRIVGLILRINSPGGTVTASDIVYHEIARFKEETQLPVYAFIMDVGASGGYYVAAAADKIYGHPTSVTGSIGVIAMKFNVSPLMEKIGVANDSIKSGDKKDLMSPFRAHTPEEHAIIQTIIDRLHQRFVEVIYKERSRQLTKDKINALADGRIYLAQQALENRLIDQIGYLEDAVNEIKTQQNIKEAKVVTYYRPGDYKSTIYSQVPADSSLTELLGLMLSVDTSDSVRFMYLWNP
ncbi:MAG TPA: signal peptide peptidase SppA [Thermodesulfovibrionia bacterium]|nr:signal peptide peptidase SppA [Thermodesulfovibrionia bacterium]